MKPILKWARRVVVFLVLFSIWVWTLGALYYMSGAARSGLGEPVLIGFVIVTAAVLLVRRRYAPWWILGVGLVGLVWFLTTQPSNDRDWLVGVARAPGVEFDGDLVTIRNIRNFHYRSVDDFDVDYYDKQYDLGQLDSVDLVMCYWDGNTRVAHTMLAFGFGGEDYICLSVEIRRENGEDWGALPGLYKQFEVIYVLADERDLINLRTSYRKEELYMYRLKFPRDEIRQYFMLTLEHIDKFNREPEFYGSITQNCSTSLTRMSKELWPDRPRAVGLLNGRTDEHLYGFGRISTELPFAELKRRSYITPVGQEHKDAADFSQKIREALP